MSGSATNKQGVTQAGTAISTGQNMSNALSANAGNLFGTLAPQLTSEAINPTGYGATDLAAMNTAAQQSVGGSTAGAVGAGNRMAARTRNAGSFTAAADEAMRQGMRQNSSNALNIQGQNARLKEEQRQAGLKGLEGLYGTDISGSLQALGLEAPLINAETTASKKTGGFLDTLQQLSQIAANGGKAAEGFAAV